MEKIIRVISAALLLSLVNISVVLAEEPLPDDFQMLWRIEGNGTHFELNNSEYLNITLDSSEPIKLVLESVPEIVTMYIEPISGASSATITLTGFLPLTMYHKYEDDYHDHTAFTTDNRGNYTYIQDLSKLHLIFIQPVSSTKFISDDATGGDCTLIGTWDAATKTCTLIMDVNETIQIDNDNIILDGAGHTITGVGTGYGIYLIRKTGVTLNNLNVKNFVIGIYLPLYSSGTKITNNIVSNNRVGIGMSYNSDSNTLNNNFANSNDRGIEFFVSYNNNLKGNIATNNARGYSILASSGNRLDKNIAHSNSYGIYLAITGGNTMTNNTISNNSYGIGSYDEGVNYYTYNTLSNNYVGIDLFRRPPRSGGVMMPAVVYNNNFLNNAIQASVHSYIAETFNRTLPTGGNYWSDYDTPEEGCDNLNGDSFCDAPYVFSNGQDSYPWIRQNGWLDNITPTTTINLSGTVGNNNWYVSDVQVILNSVDNEGGSGVAKTEYTTDGATWLLYTAPFVIADEGITTIEYRSTDNAGNFEPVNTFTIRIDKTLPTIVTPALASNYIFNSSPIQIIYSANDDISGISSVSTMFNGNTINSGDFVDLTMLGTNILTIVAVDNAGNTATQTATFTVTYNFLGILPPIREDGSSIFKLGSTVPVKFRIADANDNYVSTATANLTYQKITDEILGTVEEPVSTSAANEGNTFRYDSIDNLYIFNLGTEGMNTGTYQLNINLDDGTVYTVRISLR